MTITYRIECLPEDAQIEGNCSAVDPETDKQTAQWIRDQLERGNEWAWCMVRVTAVLVSDDLELTGYAYLGCCSYQSDHDFMSGGYYDDMKKEAFADLITSLKYLASKGAAAQRALDDLENDHD